MAASAHSAFATRIRCAWRGPSLLVLDHDGGAGRHPVSGYFFREARHLSRLGIELFGETPRLCSIAELAPDRIGATMIYPPVAERRGGGSGSGGESRRHGILTRGLTLHLDLRVRPASLLVEVELVSRWDEHVDVDLAFLLDADFADVVEAHSEIAPEGRPVAAEAKGGGVVFTCGHPDLPLATGVAVDGADGWSWADGRLATRLALRRQERATLRLRVVPHDAEDPIDAAGEEARERRLAEWMGGVARVRGTGDTPLARAMETAVAELGSLALLDGPEDEWLTPAAGVPLYPALFGRDALTIGWQASLLDRGRLVADSHRCLRRLQGRVRDPWRDEQPGRIVQQARRGPLSRLGQVPFGRYYGDVASPFMFVIALGSMLAFGGKDTVGDAELEAAHAVLDWARTDGDRDGDGYVEYLTESPAGPRHQGWKDSDNAVVDERGAQVAPPLAPCEIQGYWYAALQVMGVLTAVLGDDPERGGAYLREAAELKARFDRDFWLEDEGFVAFCLDADKRPVASIGSNPGQCLPTGIVAAERVPRLVARLFRDDLMSGWGIRTLAATNPAFNPLSYHLGSVWPAENATILLGLRRYGYVRRVLDLATAMHDLSRLWHDDRIPECVGGYARDTHGHPGVYPQANSVQGWNLSAFPLTLHALLGLQPVAPLGVLFVDPILPDWLPELRVEGLRVGDASVDLHVRRDGDDGRADYAVTRTEGRLRVLRQPPVDDLHAGPWDRLKALLGDLVPLS